jgi:hypothetical protein
MATRGVLSSFLRFADLSAHYAIRWLVHPGGRIPPWTARAVLLQRQNHKEAKTSFQARIVFLGRCDSDLLESELPRVSRLLRFLALHGDSLRSSPNCEAGWIYLFRGSFLLPSGSSYLQPLGYLHSEEAKGVCYFCGP